MKNLFLLLLLLISFQTFAQNSAKPTVRAAENKADATVKRLTNSLSLTPEQQPKVRAIVLERIQKSEEIRNKYKNSKDKKSMHQELKAVRQNSDKSLHEILTPEQITKLQKIKEDKRRKTQAKKGKITQEDVDELLDE